MPENGWMQLLAAAGQPFHSIFVNRHTIAQISIFSALSQPTLWLRNAPCSPKAAPTCQFNQMAFSQERFCLHLPENRWMQLVACSGELFYSQIGHRHTITQISFDFSACFQSMLSHRNATGLPKSAATRQFNRIAFSESRFCLQLPENRSMQLVACPGEPFFS